MAGETKNTDGAKSSPALRYVDLPDCAETFADSIHSVTYDGQTMRIEFSVTRMDDAKKGAPLTGRRYPACRLVLSPAAAIELINRMQQTASALQQAGMVKPQQKGAAPAAP
jgi:hypothetical protein